MRKQEKVPVFGYEEFVDFAENLTKPTPIYTIKRQIDMLIVEKNKHPAHQCCEIINRLARLLYTSLFQLYCDTHPDFLKNRNRIVLQTLRKILRVMQCLLSSATRKGRRDITEFIKVIKMRIDLTKALKDGTHRTVLRRYCKLVAT